MRPLYIAGLTGALAMSIIMLLVTFTGIAPNWQTQIAMGAMAFIVGFFGVQGLLSGTPLGFWICILFSIVEVFSHVSLGLVSTHVQSQAVQKAEASGGVDPEYERLVSRAKALDNTATDLASKVVGLSEGFKSEVDIRQKGIDAARQAAREASDAITAYVQAKASGKVESVQKTQEVMIDADRFFTAIPDALSSGNAGRIIAFVMYSLLFSGIVLTALMTAQWLMRIEEMKQAEEEAKALELEAEKEQEAIASRPRVGRRPGVARVIPRKVVYAWVDALWHNHRDGTSDKIIDRDLTLKFLLEKKIPITKNYDDKLFAWAIKLKLFDSDGTIHKTAMEAKTALDEAQKRKE
jgi:hypothetical protein